MRCMGPAMCDASAVAAAACTCLRSTHQAVAECCVPHAACVRWPEALVNQYNNETINYTHIGMVGGGEIACVCNCK